MAENNSEQSEKKGGAVPWMSQAASVGGGAQGGGIRAGMSAMAKNSYFAGGKLTTLGKFATFASSKAAVLTTMTAGLAVGISGMNDMNARGGFGVEPVEQKVEFDQRNINYAPEQTANLPGASASGESALEMAYAANAGRTADAAAAEAGAAAAEEDIAAADADADAIGGTEEGDGEAANGNNPDDLLAGLMGKEGTKAKAGLGKKFGQLSSGLGGGGSKLSGGSGMSSGIGGKFKGGLSNSRLRKNSSTKSLSKGRKAGKGRSKVAARGQGASLRTGANGRRLSGMQQAMAANRPAGGETQAAEHSRQWDSASTTGGGQSTGGAGTTVGDDFSDTEGGGIGSSIDTSPGASPNTDVTDVPGTGSGDNVTPYQGMVDMAVAMLGLASALNLIAFILGVASNGSSVLPPVAAALRTAAMWLSGIAAVLAGIVALMGLAIMSQGQTGQGTMFTIVGGVVSALSAVAAFGVNPQAAATGEMAKVAVVPLVASIGATLIGTGGAIGGATAN
jgi:hypothetical protein